MPDDLQTHRDLGRLSEAVRSLQEVVHELQQDVQRIEATLAEARGGWRTLMWLGGAAGAAGAAVGAYLHSIFPQFPGGHP